MARRRDIPVEIRGQHFASEQAAADHFGISRRHVQNARRGGWLDQVGLGRGWKPQMRVRIRGRDFETVDEAARALKCSRGTIWQQVWRGNPDAAGLGKARQPANARPVTIGPLRFASMAEASRELGFSRAYMSNVMRRGSKPGMQNLVAAAMRLAAERDRRAA